ncbi:coproporphyrinogen-III oxidase family protein [Shewanella woodyi]|uniref:coproporphyrinogen-III oxidase family protein n=1 Tax=Shewanella woodyi TaxID=60961 RepID=UPI003749D83B
MTLPNLPFWKEYPTRDSEWVRQYPTRHHSIKEEEVFGKQQMGIYVHIPFCNRLCFSCPYIKHQTDKTITRRYLDALKTEISNYAARPYVQDHEITLGYIGGGTPTALSSAELEELLGHLHSELNMSDDVELSIETTPIDITKKKAETLYNNGVKRISLGVQTFVQEELESIGRPSDPKMLENAIKICQEAGFTNINIDLMHGLNGQTMESWEYSLDKAIELGVTCVSFYTYMEFAQVSTKRRKLPPVPTTDVVDEMFMFAAKKLTENGFDGYFGDCFAKPGYQPRYGERSWSENIPIIPLGPTATGHLKDHWYFNEPSINKYIEVVNSGQLPISMGQYISKEEAIRRGMILGVKASKVDRKMFKHLYGVDFAEKFQSEIQDLESKGLVELTQNELKVTDPKGWYYLDNISKTFYSESFKRYPQHLGSDITEFQSSVAEWQPIEITTRP